MLEISSPVSVQAHQHTGSPASATALARWLVTGSYEDVTETGEAKYCPAVLNHAGQTMTARIGDWVVYEQGQYTVYADRDFKRKFLAVKEALNIAVCTVNKEAVSNMDIDFSGEIRSLGVIGQHIRHVQWHQFPGSDVVVCLMTLNNGFPVTGEYYDPTGLMTLDDRKCHAMRGAAAKIDSYLTFVSKQESVH